MHSLLSRALASAARKRMPAARRAPRGRARDAGRAARALAALTRETKYEKLEEPNKQTSALFRGPGSAP